MLKLLACLTMLMDHVGYVFFPGQLWLRVIGRLAFPLFCYYLSVGFMRTRSRGRYLLRLALWGLISQMPFSLLFHGGSLANPRSLVTGGTNVLVTFSLALCGLWLIHAWRGKGPILQGLSFIGMGLAAWMAIALKTDYGAYGVGTVLLFFLFREPTSTAVSKDGQPHMEGRHSVWLFRLLLLSTLFFWTLVCIPMMRMHPIQLYCVAAIPLLWLRLPDPRPGRWKHVFYAFYPVHLTVLWLLVMQWQ